jgi:hypothetical protein
MSVAVWVKLDPNSENYDICQFRDANGNTVLQFEARNDGGSKPGYRIYLQGYDSQNTLTEIKDLWGGSIQPKGQWVHMAVVFDKTANKVTLYLNGQELVSSTLTNALDLSGSWTVGTLGSTTSGRRPCLGLMDEFYLFNRALAPVEIKILSGAEVLAGDANGDGLVDVGDLGILAANYGGTNKTWPKGDFNKDGQVDVGDLGILAAHYGQGSQSSQALNFSDDYAKAFGTTATADDTEDETLGSSMCSSLGLPLIAGLALMGLMLVKLEE